MNKYSYSIGVVIVLLVSTMITSVACSGPGSKNQTTEKLSSSVERQSGDTVSEIKGMSQNFTLEKLIESSDLIVRGEITKILPSQKGTEGPLDIIYTDLIFKVSEFLFGDTQSHNIAIRLWGGRIEKEVALVEWEPILTVGEDIVLFLFLPPNSIQPVPEGFTDANYYKVTGSSNGKWIVNGNELSNNSIESKYEISEVRQQIADIKPAK